jgi:hypothetical protein
MALSPYMMRMMGGQMGARPGTISGLTQPMSLGVQPIMPLMGQQSTMPEMNAGVPEDSFSKARRAINDVMAAAPKGIDPNIEAILARKEKRLADQESQIEDGGSVWDKLGRFSAALLANESPSFAVGLGQSINATLADEQRRRDAATQRRSAIQESRDELEMERIRQAGAGRKQAMEEFKLTADIAGNMGMEELRSAQAAVERAKLIQDPQMRALELREAQLKLLKIQSEIDENNRSNRGGGDGEGRRMTPGQVYSAEQEYIKADNDYQQARAEYKANYDAERGGEPGGSARIDPAIFAKYKAAESNRARTAALFQSTFGRPPAGASRVAAVRPTGGRTTAAPSTTGWSAVQF